MPTLKAADNTELHVTSLGEGRPIVFLHGGLGWDSSYLVKTFSPMFDDENYRLVFLDIRGNGQSKFDGELSFELFVSDVRVLCDALGERVALFGHSYGGLIAQLFALQHPEYISSLILDSTFPVFDFLPESMARIQAKASPSQMVAFGRLFTEVGNDEEFANATADLLPLYLHAKSDVWIAQFRAEVLFRVDPFRKGSALLGGFNTTEQLKKINMPTWIAGGVSDIYPPEQTAVRLNKLILNSRLELFQKSGHFPFVEESAKYRSEMKKFLSEVA